MDEQQRLLSVPKHVGQAAKNTEQIMPSMSYDLTKMGLMTKSFYKMLSMEIVKRVGMNRYWLDEKRAADGKGVLKQRLLIIAIAVVLGVTLGILRNMGILNF